MTATWKIEKKDNGTWSTWSGVTLKKIPEILNGHMEAQLLIPNTSANRTICAANQRVRISFDAGSGFTIIFDGILYAPTYGEPFITGYVYDECIKKMKDETITATYPSTAANTILSAICTQAGVVAGSCPTTTITVRFVEAECFVAAKFVAECCRKDWWPDRDGSDNPRFNIGDRGSSLGSVTPVSISENKVDRAQAKNHAIVRGVDSDGIEIIGHAYVSGSSVVEGEPSEPYDHKKITFTERKGGSVDTLNKIAASKLTEYMKEQAGSTLAFKITDAYDWEPGDEVTLSKPELVLSGDFRIYKTTKFSAIVKCEIERLQADEAQEILDLRRYEDYGIYPVVEEQVLFDVPASVEYGPIASRPTCDADHEGQEYWATDTGEKWLCQLNGTYAWQQIGSFPIDIDDITPTTPVTPSLEAADITPMSDTDEDGRTIAWFKVEIPRVNNMAGYVLSYFRQGTTDYRHIVVEQPASGDAVVHTEYVALNTSWGFRVCSFNEHGEYSAWSSTFYKTSAADTTPPGIPQNLSATTNLMGGVLLTWDEVTDDDLSHYNIYVSTTTTPPGSPTYRTRTNFFFYKINVYDTNRYFWVSSEDIYENESTKSSMATGQAKQVLHLDLGPNAVEAENILNGEVETNKLDDLAVTNDKIANLTIQAGKIAAGAITTQKLSVYSVFCDDPNFSYLATNKIQWDAFDLQYEGSITAISSGSSDQNDVYVYWKKGDTSLSHTPDKPAWQVDLFILAYRDGTDVYEMWNASYIHGGTLITGTVTALEIKAQTITSEEIALSTILSNRLIRGEARNLIINGGFEVDSNEDGDPDFWPVYEATRVSTSGYIYEDTYATRINSPGTGNNYIQTDEIQLNGGDFVCMTFYARSVSVANCDCYAAIDYYNSGDSLIGTDGLLVANEIQTTYKRFDLEGDGAPTGTAYCKVRISVDNTYTGDIVVDSVSLEKSISAEAIIQIIADKVIFTDTGDDLTDVTGAEGGATVIEGGKIRTLSVDTDQLTANAVEADKIAANAVRTEHLYFDRITSDPADYRTLWYRYDVDQLRFRGDSGETGYIPRIPIRDRSAPPENMLPNGAFEYDTNEDDIPDFWTLSGTITDWIYSAQRKGGHSVKLDPNSGQTCYALSDYVPVAQGQDYVPGIAYSRVAGTSHLYCRIYWYGQTGGSPNASPITYDQQDVGNTSGWSIWRGLPETAPTNARYARVRFHVTYSTGENYYIDDAFLSEARAAISTDESPIAAVSTLVTGVSGGSGTWVTAINNHSIPNEDHDVYCLFIAVCPDANDIGTTHYRNIRVHDNTDGIYYPVDSSTNTLQLQCYVYSSGGNCTTSYFITIPKNIAGHSIDIDFYTNLSSGTDFIVMIRGYGHSPHRHP